MSLAAHLRTVRILLVITQTTRGTQAGWTWFPATWKMTEAKSSLRHSPTGIVITSQVGYHSTVRIGGGNKPMECRRAGNQNGRCATPAG